MDIPRAERSVAEEGLSAWLFYNFQHRDKIADRILDIPETALNTRPWVYLLRPGSEPLKLVHAIEQRILERLPGQKRVYASRVELVQALRELSQGLGRTACQFSSELPVLSYLDHGTALLLQECGFNLGSSAVLIQRFLGLLSEEGMRSHESAARRLYGIVREIWERIRASLGTGESLTEGAVQEWILERFQQYSLLTESAPVVAVGAHSADPHYEVEHGGAILQPGGGAALQSGRVLQLDLWAREDAPGSVYADISWVGLLAPVPAAEIQRAFAAVASARDAGLELIERSMQRGEPPTGLQVDKEVRAVLQKAGYGAFLKHRTGHAIDAQLHGYGVNLDSVEFPDSRRIMEGSCFSIEPGVYLAEFGLRSEINVYIRAGKPVVSGGTPQSELLTL